MMWEKYNYVKTNARIVDLGFLGLRRCRTIWDFFQNYMQRLAAHELLPGDSP